MHKRLFQKNNLIVFQVCDYPQKHTVETKDGRVLEEFRYAADAREFCARTFDYVKWFAKLNPFKYKAFRISEIG